MLKLSKYADEQGALADVEDAAFLGARKLTPEATIDFEGITSVTPAYLDALFAGVEPAQLSERITGLAGPTAATVSAWLDARGLGAPCPESPSEDGWETGERYSATRLAHRLRLQLRQYLESAYPLNDPTLLMARRRLLDEAEGGRLLAQEPFVETTPRYRSFEGGYSRLARVPAETRRLFEELGRIPQDRDPERTLLFPELYVHQARALEAFLGERRDLIVATGTGSGKTECFLLPILGALWEEATHRPESFARRGVRALILYPMNALVNDQLARLRLLFGSAALAERFDERGSGRHPCFGMYTGRTPYPGPRSATKDAQRVKPLIEHYLGLPPELADHFRRLGRFPSKDLGAFLAAHLAEQGSDGRSRHHWSRRLRTGPSDRELLTRQEMIASEGGASPDLLVTNYSMLEYMLMRPFERPIFDQTRAWLEEPESRLILVLDEAHLYRGAKGAEVAFLIRRLLARLDLLQRPEKLAVIVTSASLGAGRETALAAQRFAADLTGRSPAGFELVLGEREAPTPVGTGSPELARVLAAIDLEALHAGASTERLEQALVPLFDYLGIPVRATDEAELLRELHDALLGRPFLNRLVQEAAGRAISLEALSERVFPGATEARKATEALLTLGMLAKRRPDEPGLVPARLHMMFRGLHGLYACLHPACPGRQARPGETAPVGKLFAAPRSTCDACGARVFELCSCRDCGSAYLRAYAPDSGLDRLDFLWGEMEGDLMALHVLPTAPRQLEEVEEVRVQLATGCLVSPDQGTESETRSLWLACDAEGRRMPSFKRCPICLPPGSRRQSRLRDFRTKGEQPFTALIEAQFSEQPPQIPDPALPNRGRKVLVFSDGRQKAARLAPALEASHTRDAFRQVLWLAARELEAQGAPARLGNLYSAVLHVSAQRELDLFPSRDETQFHHHLALAQTAPLSRLLMLGGQGSLQPPLSFGRNLFAELTDRFFSLAAIGMAGVEEDPAFDFVLAGFPEVGLEAVERRIILRNWLRVQLERRCFIPPGATPLALREDYEYPQGIDRRRASELVPERFRAYLLALVGTQRSVERVVDWFEGLLDKQFLQFVDDRFYLSAIGLVLRPRLRDPWLRCTSCNRLQPQGVRATCHECLGQLVDASADPFYLEARSGYYRAQVQRAARKGAFEPFGLSTAEHSAQLTALDEEEAFTRTESYELRFQDVRVGDEPPLDVLSCTTTMEVGIDIGSLSGVALRNVPPHVANYQQRAGRAGRRGRAVASVITYAHGGSHDAHHYADPAAMIAGDVRPPIVYIENRTVLERHIHAYLVQSFFHEAVPTDPDAYSLFASLGDVRSFLDEAQPVSLAALERWLLAHESRLTEQLRTWVPAIGHGQGRVIDAEASIAPSVSRLLAALSEALPCDLWRRREALTPIEKEALERQLAENLLKTLIDRAIFPRYAFPTDTVSFWVRKRRRAGAVSAPPIFDYQPQRDLQIALSEFAPGRTLTIDKFRFTSAALYSPYQPGVGQVLEKARAYSACKACGFVSLREDSLPSCPVCGGERLQRRPFLTPEGFAPDVHLEREVDRGGAGVQAGHATPAKLEIQDRVVWEQEACAGRLRLAAGPRDLVVVNKGVADQGFWVCGSCGRSEPVAGPSLMLAKGGGAKQHHHPVVEGGICADRPSGPFFLGHRFLTDVLLLRFKLEDPVSCPLSLDIAAGKAGRSALVSLVEAIGLAASRCLQIEEGEIAGNWNPVLNGGCREVDAYLYDLLPGGAGYARQVKESLPKVLEATEQLLASCDCVGSCYRCLRHYGNHGLHGGLDRHLALALLRHVRHGEIPSLSPEGREAALAPLGQLLRLKGFAVTLAGEPEGALRVRANPSRMVRVGAYHPLLDPASEAVPPGNAGPSSPAVAIDAYTLLHDLPQAYKRITEALGGER